MAADRATAYHYYHWDWGEAIAMEGMWLAASLTATPRYREYVERMVRGWIAHSPDPWYPDHIGPGTVLLEMWHREGDAALLTYAERLGRHLAELPRGRLGASFHRPDLPDRARLVWVDSMQTDAPFLCRLAHATGDGAWFDRATEHICGHIAALQDCKTGLFYHNYDEETGRRNGIHWARGNGWAILGLVRCLESLPPFHLGHSVIRESLRRLACTLVGAQDPETSLWHNVVDHPETSFETSASLMIACALMRAGRLALLKPVAGTAGARAWLTLWRRVDPDGTVQGVSARTPPRGDVASYEARPTGGNYPWGQGSYLLAAAAWLETARGHNGSR
jgi:unsaturated rhamnogalacturonyl hydrolase